MWGPAWPGPEPLKEGVGDVRFLFFFFFFFVLMLRISSAQNFLVPLKVSIIPQTLFILNVDWFALQDYLPGPPNHQLSLSFPLPTLGVWLYVSLII